MTKQIKRVKELLAIYYDRNMNEIPDKGDFLTFDVEGDLNYISKHLTDKHLKSTHITIYNPTKPISVNNKRYLFGRVEPFHSNESHIIFFEEKENIWRVVDEAPILHLEDPFHLPDIHGWHLIGGVKTFENPSRKGEMLYRTVFYRYKESLSELISNDGEIVPPFAEGPIGMKDIRMIQLANGKIGVFTRPQGGEAGLGKIGYIQIDRIEELEKCIPKGKIIEDQFHRDEWGGVNELHLLKNECIGVLGHIAHYDGDVRHYYAMAFVFDPNTCKHSHMEILTTADDFPPVKPKKDELGKVIFSGGLHRNKDGTADLYVGIGDVKAGKIRIADPFLKYE